jgi:hypothetical protein
MVSKRDFLSGIIAGFLGVFVTPQIIGYIPNFGIGFLTLIYTMIFFGIWVVVATLILEKTGH